MDVRLVPMRAEGCTLRAGAHCSDGWDVATPWHRHDMHQLLYAFEGALEVEGAHGRYVVPRQFAVWIPAGSVHRTTIQKVASGSIFLSPDMVASPGDGPRVIPAPDLLREMVMHAMRWPLDRGDDAPSAAYFECFAHLCHEWIAAEVRLILPSSGDDARVAAAMAFTRRHIAGLAFRDVCRHAALSERSLRRRFLRVAGMSWEEYRLRLRMVLALDALERTADPIGAIAADIGYASPAAFAKTFRAFMGIGPNDYRRGKRAH